MSDDWITLIPEDPRFVPEEANLEKARLHFTNIAPDAHEIEVRVYEQVRFFDCGGNSERIICPFCRTEIPGNWWSDRMNEDYSAGFKLSKYSTPCCGARITLHDLVYEWPQGFGRFGLSAMNPNIGLLDEKYQLELETILGTKLRVIYQHL